MKIIDLLNKIAKGEEVPTRIRLLESAKYSYYYNDIDKCYTRRAGKNYFVDLGIEWDIVSMLNDEVEILDDENEEKGLPEKLKWNEKSQHNVVTDNTKKTLEHLLSRSEQLKKSINEIIDYLEKQRKGE